MGYFYELTMEKGKYILTVGEVLNSLDNPIKREEVFNRLRSSEQLSEELQGIKDFLEANHYDHEKLRSFVKRSEENFDNIINRSNERKTSTNWLRVAAVIVPIIGLATFFYLNQQETDLYTKYYEKENGLPVFMGIEDNKQFNDAMNAFKDNEFNEAINGFDDLLAANQKNDTLLYFMACSNMELGNYQQAIDQFQMVNDVSVFKEKSAYREVLSLIALEHYSEAKSRLTEIAQTNGNAYQNQAAELLKEKRFR